MLPTFYNQPRASDKAKQGIGEDSGQSGRRRSDLDYPTAGVGDGAGEASNTRRISTGSSVMAARKNRNKSSSIPELPALAKPPNKVSIDAPKYCKRSLRKTQGSHRTTQRRRQTKARRTYLLAPWLLPDSPMNLRCLRLLFACQQQGTGNSDRRPGKVIRIGAFNHSVPTRDLKHLKEQFDVLDDKNSKSHR